MNRDEILFLLAPNVIKCTICEKYYHTHKTKILLDKIAKYLDSKIRCAACGWSERHFYIEMKTNNIPFSELEETYGNLYEIIYKDDNLIFKKREKQ